MGFIYKITNDINNKVYIGQTTLTLDQRFRSHIHDCMSGKARIEKRPLYEAMLKYGIQHFQIELLEEVVDELLDEKEMFYIKQYNSYVGFSNSNGYNATLGGQSIRKIDWTAEKLEALITGYNFGKNCSDLARELNCHPETIATKLKSLGYAIRPSNQHKFVCQLDLDGRLINIFSSAQDAARALNNSSKNLHISEVCKGKRKTGGGYRWMYYEDYIKQIED